MTSTLGHQTSAAALAKAGWAALPPAYRFPETTPSLAEAEAYCRRLAASHYENFSVATWFLPRRLRPHFHCLYAYCRISDDLGDEVGNGEQSLALLDEWEAELDATYRGHPRHPVFVALWKTICQCDIPKKPFADLLKAFRQDQTTTRYQTLEDLLQYCVNSANPVGHLVLYACGYRDEERQRLSDYTCTGLQLANFWQDVATDYQKGRVYLPLEHMHRYGVAEAVIAEKTSTDEFKRLMAFEVAAAREWFERGLPLSKMVDRDLAVDLELFTRGGQEILNAIQRRSFDVLTGRPVISKPRKLALVARAVLGKLF